VPHRARIPPDSLQKPPACPIYRALRAHTWPGLGSAASPPKERSTNGGRGCRRSLLAPLDRFEPSSLPMPTQLRTRDRPWRYWEGRSDLTTAFATMTLSGSHSYPSCENGGRGFHARGNPGPMASRVSSSTWAGLAIGGEGLSDPEYRVLSGSLHESPEVGPVASGPWKRRPQQVPRHSTQP